MGLIKAAINSVAGTIRNQWKEYFTCDSLGNEILACKGTRNGKGYRGEDNIITAGSGIVVSEGQCVITTVGGKIEDVVTEPGEFEFTDKGEPSIFAGSFTEALKASWNKIVDRFTYGGDTSTDHRVYYINMREIVDNKFGTVNPVPFRYVDKRMGLDLDLHIRCSGTYMFKIVDPVLFFAEVCGNVTNVYRRSDLEIRLKAELVDALSPAFSKLCSENELRPYEVSSHNFELKEALSTVLDPVWESKRGISLEGINLNVNIPEEDQKQISDAQKAYQNNLLYTNAAYAQASINAATADAIRDAAKNSGGVANTIFGVNMVANAGAQAAAATGAWTCPTCGTVCSGNFCSTCGAKKPQ